MDYPPFYFTQNNDVQVVAACQKLRNLLGLLFRKVVVCGFNVVVVVVVVAHGRKTDQTDRPNMFEFLYTGRRALGPRQPTVGSEGILDHRYLYKAIHMYITIKQVCHAPCVSSTRIMSPVGPRNGLDSDGERIRKTCMCCVCVCVCAAASSEARL